MISWLPAPMPIEVVEHADWQGFTGEGYAFAVIDYSQEHDLLWLVGMDTGEFVQVPNAYVRRCRNWSLECRTYTPKGKPFDVQPCDVQIIARNPGDCCEKCTHSVLMHDRATRVCDMCVFEARHG